MTHSSFRTTVHLPSLFQEAARLLPFRLAGTLFPNSILLCSDILTVQTLVLLSDLFPSPFSELTRP